MRKPDRSWKDLPAVEMAIHRSLSYGPAYKDGVPILVIEYFQEFEKWGHHEDWGTGFRVKGMLPDGEVLEATAEHIDEAVEVWAKQFAARMEETPDYIKGMIVPNVRRTTGPTRPPKPSDLAMENPWERSEIGRESQDAFRKVIES